MKNYYLAILLLMFISRLVVKAESPSYDFANDKNQPLQESFDKKADDPILRQEKVISNNRLSRSSMTKESEFIQEMGYLLEYLHLYDKWGGEKRYNYKYDDKGNLLHVFGESWIDGNWKNDVKRNNIYDSRGNRICGFTEEFIDNEWDESHKDTIIYHQDGKLKERIEWIYSTGMSGAHYLYCYQTSKYKYNSKGYLIEKSIKQHGGLVGDNGDLTNIVYIYDMNGRIKTETEEYYIEGSEEVNLNRKIFEYDGQGNFKTITYQSGNESYEWENYGIHYFTYNPQNLRLCKEYERYHNGKRYKEERLTYTYDSNDNLITETREEWDSGTGWIYDYRKTFEYDINNNITGGYFEEWDNTWIPVNEYIKIDYDDYPKSLNKYLIFDPLCYRFEATYKSITGIKSKETEEIRKAFPNPFSDLLQIEYFLAEPGYISIRLYNSLGELIRELPREYKVPGKYMLVIYAGDYPPGVYFLHIRDGARSTVLKAIKK